MMIRTSRICLNYIEASGKHRGQQFTNQRSSDLILEACCRSRSMLEVKLHHVHTLLWITLHCHYQRRSGGDVEDGFPITFRAGDTSKQLPYLFNNCIRIYISYHNHSHIIGIVPFMVECTQNLRLEILHHAHLSDRQSCTVRASGVYLGGNTLKYTVCRSVALTPFINYHTTFIVNIFVGKSQGTTPVAHYQQTRIHDLHPFHRHF